ncbi:MAG: winged helix-turn-helix domain-containing protein [Thermoanaerobaculia bacterium]
MPIPDFQTIMLPLLRIAADGAEHAMRDARPELAREFALTPEELVEPLPSGKQSRFSNRVAWAKSYLSRAALVETPREGYFKITPRGVEVLNDPPDRITIGFLNKFPEIREFRKPAVRVEVAGPASSVDVPDEEMPEVDTPEEVMGGAYQRIRSSLAADLLARVKAPRHASSRISSSNYC